MLTVLSVIFPIFLIMLIGYVAARLSLVSSHSLSDMGRYVIYIALPAVILKTVLNIDLQAMLNYRYLSAYALASIALTLIGLFFYQKILGLGKLDTSVSITGMVLPNSSFIGYPIIIQLIDNAPVNAFAMALLVENLCVLPLCFILMDYSNLNNQQPLKIKVYTLLKRIIKNPLLIAILLGVIGNLLDLQLPATLETTLDLLAPSAVAVALIVIGGALAQIRIGRSNVTQLLSVTMGKLIIHPLLAILMLHLLLPGHYELKLALVIIAAMPMFSVYSVIGDMYRRQAFCSSAQLVTNLLSIITIPIMITLAQAIFG
ncbi:AEC family transporter [Vibrio viridaestus]|uniref:AEC family transporter n=1 Tax=Vibrio viridaestus TaxID=2487322 RepID=A0A3N9TKP8_9VIBR|nr:AEC family transporter [Vibrio viridaestus]RQW64968.1 AEC family transporter [Vibrio viridaestus]